MPPMDSHATSTAAEAAPAPETGDLADWLCRQLAAALGYESVGRDDDFFELGGDSVAATALTTAVAAAHGTDLPISTIARFPTMAALATHMLSRAPSKLHPLLLPVEAEGDGIPLFMVHGLTGQAFSARYLKDRIGPRRPIYGLQAAPQRPAEAPIKTVAELAGDYIGAVRSVRSNGPYLLSATCAGAFIAWEMAQRLRAEGESVPALIAIDPPSHIGDFIGGTVLRTDDDSTEGRLLGDDAAFRRQARESIVLNTAEHDDFAWIRRNPAALAGAVETAIALRTALIDYRPEPYDGTVVMICSQQAIAYLRNAQSKPDQRKNGWAHLLRGPSHLIALRGTHRGLFRKDNPAVPDALRGAIRALGL
jgi:thioesterase domain-containing protein/acyl carrier protein